MKESSFPDDKEVIDFIESSEQKITVRELAKAFHVKGPQRRRLRQTLKRLTKVGNIVQDDGKSFHKVGASDRVAVVVTLLKKLAPELYRVQLERRREAPQEIKINIRTMQKLDLGDRLLGQIKPTSDTVYDFKVLKYLGAPSSRALGEIQKSAGKLVFFPLEKKARHPYPLSRAPQESQTLLEGMVVWGTLQNRGRYSDKIVVVDEVLGHVDDVGIFSLLSILENQIPHQFPQEAIRESTTLQPASCDNREDLRDINLVTIDGADARDFDDAVWASPSKTQNGGFDIIVAIADVAYYVRPGSPLDTEAFKRGNSVYFPDRVVPMLPERLSNDLCSLRPDEDRACLAAFMTIDKAGKLVKYSFKRAMMRSKARLTYEGVQKALDGEETSIDTALVEQALNPLYDCYQSLIKARAHRGTLELDVPEIEVRLSPQKTVQDIGKRTRLESHKLIEEFMILANVACASFLEEKQASLLYRNHKAPSAEKLENLRSSLQGFGLPTAHGVIETPKDFAPILEKAKQSQMEEIISMLVLRSQTQAYYGPENEGHFGLALLKYCHFTSPIRRYADLIVHRALAQINGWEGGLTDAEIDDIDDIGKAISVTERRAVDAERAAMNRYISAYMSQHMKAQFGAHISSVTRWGLFVRLDDTGAEGLIPMSNLPDDYYDYQANKHRLVGRRQGINLTLGDEIRVCLEEARPLVGGLIFSLVVKGKTKTLQQIGKVRRGQTRRLKGGSRRRGPRS